MQDIQAKSGMVGNYVLTIPLVFTHAQRRVIVVGWSVVGTLVCFSDLSVVCGSVCFSACFLSNRGCCRYQTQICTTGARHSKSLEQEQHVYGGGLKLYKAIYSRSRTMLSAE